LKPTLEPVLTGFCYEAGISIPDGLGGTAALPILLEAWGAAWVVSNQLVRSPHSTPTAPPFFLTTTTGEFNDDPTDLHTHLLFAVVMAIFAPAYPR